MKSALHEKWMNRALALARRGAGLTRPNPPVGAVVVKNGRVVGEGWHRRAGGPHAEIYALRQAGSKARGATLYVTLEPCSTWGRTPPCTDAIVQSGIREVVVATRDPNRKHAGRGLRLLRQQGISVVDGVRAEEARSLIAPFAKWVLQGLPYLTLKMGMTLDGRIADVGGRSRWITGPASRREVQALRRSADAILIGARTAKLDNPSLLPVPSNGRRPLRVVVSRSRSLPKSLKLFSDGAAARTLVFSRRPLRAVLKSLARDHNVLHVLCEGGGELAASLIRERLVDEVVFFVAPEFLGGQGAPVVGGPGWPLAKMPRLQFTTVGKCGRDVMLRGKVRA